MPSDDIEILAEELESYIRSRKPADTMDGIVKWWFLRRGMEGSEAHVQEAVNLLVDRGRLGKKQLPDGQNIYFYISLPPSRCS